MGAWAFRVCAGTSYYGYWCGVTGTKREVLWLGSNGTSSLGGPLGRRFGAWQKGIGG
jgi:hypothetical protein